MQPRWHDWFKVLKECWVVSAIVAWKLGLIVAAALPPPSNDAFFFDGAVINWLRHGNYFNPSIVGAFPINGSEFFSAYPPGYQAVLVVWMTVFGTSVMASLLLHGVLFALFSLTVAALLRRLEVPAASVNFGGLFLLAMTFHDRPDSVAHVTGMIAVVIWLYPVKSFGGARWVAAGLIVLTLTTSLHIGAMYAAIVWMLASFRLRTEPWPWGPTLAMVVVPLVVVALVVVKWPRAWEGFTENLLATPSFTGYRLPDFDHVLKIGRTAPGLILIIVALAFPSVRGELRRRGGAHPLAGQCFAAMLAGGLFTVLATLFVVAPNYVNVAAYPQVPVVALAAWLIFPESGRTPVWRSLKVALVATAVLVSIRAVGLTTWGVACAIDVGRAEAFEQLHREIATVPDRGNVLVSSAYLYAFADDRRVTCRHADWAGPLGSGLGAFRPTCFALTAYDYHRRYKRTLVELSSRGDLRIVSVKHTVRVPTPDGFPYWQRVVQHVSWAPVIVWIEWR